ncbi:MAG: DUF1080 domain-containing protein [Pseudohongiellaceae bacterium]
MHKTRALLSTLSISAVLSLGAAVAALGSESDWRPLFSGDEDLSDWQQVGPGGFSVEEGLLKSSGGMGLLWYTPKKIGDAEIRVVFRNPGGKNSGVFIRIPEQPTEPWMPVNRGYEVQIDNNADEFHATGVLYSLTRAAVQPSVPGEWNTMIIRLEGPRTTVEVNGVLVTDFLEGDDVPAKKEWYEPDRGPRPMSGYIGVQNHGAEDIVYFKEISVRDL